MTEKGLYQCAKWKAGPAPRNQTVDRERSPQDAEGKAKAVRNADPASTPLLTICHL